VAEPADDVELRILLVGSAAEVAEAFQRIDDGWRNPICANLRQRFLGLTSEDIKDAWQDTMVQLLKVVRDGPFDAEQPLWPFVWKIANARATDRLRHLTRTSRDDVLQAIGESLRGSSLATLSQTERREFRELYPRLLLTLPSKQRVVLQAWVNGFPETNDMQRLRHQVGVAIGEEQTLASVKRALQEARRKAREFFEAKGYGQGTSQ
jgi:DNA-directed RNA polymerase specialized sigma24 family protein